ncbi:MAG: MG2 domain-containing protein, partial [Gemmobacter sp.]|nr:MG2 domain-containing protein [Gemmobacter sp.]
ALQMASDMGRAHVTGDWSASELTSAAQQAESGGDPARAMRLTGAALNLTDSPELWAEYARLSLAIAGNPDQTRQNGDRAALAALNGYLRAENRGLRHTLLVYMAQGFERTGQGSLSVGALRFAQALQPRDDTAQALDRVIGLYGFRIEEHEVQSNLASPRLCATFTEDLVDKGLDYTPFVQFPEPGMTVEPGGWRQLCVSGLTHGQRATITFREGLPAADGQTLAKSTAITAYVRDRRPQVAFPGRGYVLPRSGTAALPVVTVNAPKLDLDLYRVSDRNLIRSFQNDYFGTPMDSWRAENFASEVAEKLWTGQAEVPVEVNRDVTTRLPLDAAISGLPSGIYALKATVPGADEYEDPSAWQWFVVSDLGLTTMSGVDGLHVVVRSLTDAGPKPGVTVTLVSRANSPLGTAVTDAMGYARFDSVVSRGTGGAQPALVTVMDGDSDLAFLSLTEPEFDLSDRGVAGREASPPIDVFLTTDRGAYRAGETVYATALARDPKTQAIAGLPLTARLKRPDGVEYSRAMVDDTLGGYVFALPIAPSAPRGQWRLEILADVDAAPLTAQTFLVEDFLPERIDFALTLPDAPLRLGDAPDVTVDARYLFGAPGAGLAIEGEVILSEAPGLDAFPGYRFGRADSPFSAVMEPIGADGTTDDAGQAVLAAVLPQVSDPGRPLQARVRVRVAEGSGRPVEREITRVLDPTAPMIGIKPGFDGVVADGAEAEFSLIAVGPGAQPVPMAVKWRIDRIETRYQWYQIYGDWNWEPMTTRSRAAEGTSTLGADPQVIAARLGWGEYELTVERDGASGGASVRFNAGWYAPADTSRTPDTLELSLDKPAYKAGDTAQLRLVPRSAGVALVSVLSNRLVSMQAIEVTEGENMISLPVTDDWGAGVYVTASVLRPMDATAGRL